MVPSRRRKRRSSPRTPSAWTEPMWMWGDFNRDGLLDLSVVIGLNGSRIAILIGNGDGTFRQPTILTDPGTRVPQSQAIADYNGDGFLDLAFGMGWGLQGWLSIWNGNGDGPFRGPCM